MSTAPQESAEPHRNRHPITITVDDESLTTTESEMSPNAILRLAGLDPSSHYLVKIDGRHQTSYQDRGDEPIHVHEHEVFVSVSTEPTPVS
jgi:hypothetical protein